MTKSLLLLFCWIAFLSVGQISPPPSIHQEQLIYYNSIGKTASFYQTNNQPAFPPVYNKVNCNLNKIVYGWHPYWSNGLETNYQWNLLTDLAYFSYEVNPNTGNAISTHGFSTANVIDEALSHGVRVSLCVTLFGGSNHDIFLGNPSAQQALISNLINLVQSRGIDGINIDFEGLKARHKNDFSSFIADLSTQLKGAISGAQLSLTLYAVDWGPAFNIPALETYTDLFIIMGYDYFWSGSTKAGPSAPLYRFENTSDYTLSKSVTNYLALGVPKDKLVLALPYYGRAWTVSDYPIPATTLSSPNSSTVAYKAVKNNASGYFSSGNRHFSVDSRSAYYNYISSGNKRQCFISEEKGLRERLDFIQKRGIAGMGIWALGYDDGYSDFWNGIQDYMTDCYQSPCSAILYDMGGGPNHDYYNDENYTFTVSPPGATSMDVSFSSFNVEANYDFLYIYDGNSTNAPPIPGSPFTGSTIPPPFTTGGAFTVKFVSDGATRAPGFTLHYSCHSPATDPITIVDSATGWKTNDYLQTFQDSTPSSSIKKGYYSVEDFNGQEWRANANNGFFFDYFKDSLIHPDWVEVSGNWTALNALHQSDVTNSNTNIYTALNQSLSNQYLYHWKGKIGGAGNNKRAGLHFFIAGDPSKSNREKSYFVYCRTDNQKVQIYEVQNNIFSLKKDISYPFLADKWYDYKVIYDRITGEISVFINNILTAFWTDTTPILIGNYVSFRTGNCLYDIDFFEVYRSRHSSENISIGPGAGNDIRFSNPNPNQPSGMVRSILLNSSSVVSEMDSILVNVDWTKPLFNYIKDGNEILDLDTIYTLSKEISSYWSGKDPNSGIFSYEYAVGVQPNDNSVVDWTTTGIDSSIVISNSNLSYGVKYFFTIRAKNKAKLFRVLSSDGFYLWKGSSGLSSSKIELPIIYPNPTKQFLHITISNQKIEHVFIYNERGEVVKRVNDHENFSKIDVSNLPDAIYTVVVKTKKAVTIHQLVKR